MSTVLPKVVVPSATHKHSLPGQEKSHSKMTGRQGGERSVQNNRSNSFDIERATKTFQFSFQREGVDMDAFIDGYSEICKYLKQLGVVFRFTVSDVLDKLHLLKDFRSGPTGAEYACVRDALDYEVRCARTHTGSSGARTVLLLQRALTFLALLLQRLANSQPETKAGPIAAKAYKETLSPHHAWLVRKAVQLGVHTLPASGEVLSQLGFESYQENVSRVQLLVSALQQLDKKIHTLLAERDLLSLP